MTASSAQSAIDPNANARRNALILSIAQAFNGAGPPIAISLGGLAGFYMLGADKSLATAPVTGYNIGVALTALPAAMLMGRVGRRYGFITGALATLCGMAVCGWALTMLNFWLFAVGMMLIGVGAAFVHQYRFAAADQGDDTFKPKAISWVLAGGIGAAIIGPQLVIWTKDLMLPIQFAGNPVLGGTNGLQTDPVYAAPTQFSGNPVLGGPSSGRLPTFDTGTAFAEAE